MKLEVTQKEAIARRFSEILLIDLGFLFVHAIVKANRIQSNKSICHSHDFCDANMAMLEALNEVLILKVDLNDDATMTLMGEAWNLAKAKEFYLG